MRTATFLCVLLAAIATGCTSSFQIPMNEAPGLQTGTVRTLSGTKVTVGPQYSVKPVPVQGFVFGLPDPKGPYIVAYPGGQVAADRVAAPALNGPVRASFSGPHLLLSGRDKDFVLLASSVRSLRIEQPSPEKTRVMMLGIAAGVAATVALTVVIAIAVSSYVDSKYSALSSGLGGYSGR